MPTNSGKKFLFDHVPKTAGTAFRIVLEQLFGEDRVSPWVAGRSEAWASQTYSAFPVVTGHFHSPIPGKGAATDRERLTILRDPLDRLVSEYYYYRNEVERLEWNKLAVLAKDHDLYSYVDQLAANGDAAISNFYCRRFAGQLSRTLGSPEKMLALAKKSLSRYAFVGIQEQFGDTVDVFCCRFGLPAVSDLPRTNVTGSRAKLDDLDRKTRDRLRALNRLDIELYDYALGRFQSEKRLIFHRICGVTKAGSAGEGDDAQDFHDSSPDTFGDRAIEIRSAAVTGHTSLTSVVRPGELTVITLELAAHESTAELTVGMEISDQLGEIVFGTNTHLLGRSRAVSGGRRYTISFAFAANMKHGRYNVGAALHTGATHAERCFHWCDRIATFDVADEMAADFVGYCRLMPQIEWREQVDETA